MFFNRVPGLIIAAAAVALVLGGTSYAAFTLGANSVGTKQLKNRAVTSGKLADSAVTGAKLASGAATSGKIADRAVTGAKLAPGAVTSAGLADGAVTTLKLVPGAVGSAQAQPGAGVSLNYETSTSYAVPAGSTSVVYQTCPVPMYAIGGGALPDDPHVVLVGTGPYRVLPGLFGGPTNAWAAYVTNTDTVAGHTFAVFAVCITAGSIR